MPPASLPALAAMRPGPRMASSANGRRSRRRTPPRRSERRALTGRPRRDAGGRGAGASASRTSSARIRPSGRPSVVGHDDDRVRRLESTASTTSSRRASRSDDDRPGRPDERRRCARRSARPAARTARRRRAACPSASTTRRRRCRRGGRRGRAAGRRHALTRSVALGDRHDGGHDPAGGVLGVAEQRAHGGTRRRRQLGQQCGPRSASSSRRASTASSGSISATMAAAALGRQVAQHAVALGLVHLLQRVSGHVGVEDAHQLLALRMPERLPAGRRDRRGGGGAAPGWPDRAGRRRTGDRLHVGPVDDALGAGPGTPTSRPETAHAATCRPISTPTNRTTPAMVAR